MNRTLCLRTTLAAFAATALLISAAQANDRRSQAMDANGNLNALIAKHAAANNLPEDLVRRVIHRESRGNARAISRGNYGLMQIRLNTARSLGYSGGAAGLLDADTNMTYAVKYLAGAYRAAGGNHTQAVRYYAAGYYYAAKRKGLRAEAPLTHPEAITSVARASEAEATPATETTGAVVADASERVERAQGLGESVSSSSDLFTGRIDFH